MTAPGGKTGVLIVEDDRSLRSALTTFLERIGYQVLQADNGEAALDLLAAHRLSAMLCDIRMSGMSGMQLLPRALAADPDLAVIMLTGVDEPRAAISCLKLGAADYLIKPVDLDELQHALQSALHQRDLELERRGLEEWLAHEVAARTKELVAQSRQLSRLSINVLGALVDALEARDPVLRGHSQRVADLSGRIAVRLGLSPEEVEAVRAAGRVHDIGKLALQEPGLQLAAPADDEIVAPREDPDLALRLLEPLAHLEGMAVAEIVRYQHERYDGKGVPDGRRGEDIPLGSRIVAAASVYDELSVTSADRPTLEPREAIANLRSLVGLMLDPKVFAALVLEVAGTP
ncbi:MAG TPA: HD domain-containing phosphohydrolase [Gemmatimonadales bacterium]|nr:HD domain-containing phosphohydrolase [Gemmatimonadales bacterium]